MIRKIQSEPKTGDEQNDVQTCKKLFFVNMKLVRTRRIQQHLSPRVEKCCHPKKFASTLHLFLSKQVPLFIPPPQFFSSLNWLFRFVFAAGTICKQSKCCVYLLQTIRPNYRFQGQSRSALSLQMQMGARSVPRLIAGGKQADSCVPPLPD